VNKNSKKENKSRWTAKSNEVWMQRKKTIIKRKIKERKNKWMKEKYTNI